MIYDDLTRQVLLAATGGSFACFALWAAFFGSTQHLSNYQFFERDQPKQAATAIISNDAGSD
jgi:hypothetical protein